jgi:peptidoglycan/xylan/chitin deacetylase (PgdA/CDA1 family)
MSFRDAHSRRREEARKHRANVRRGRLVAFGSLGVVTAIVLAAILGSLGGSGPSTKLRSSGGSLHSSNSSSTAAATRQPGTQAVPILTYHVINVPPVQTTTSADLYVPADEFSSQMQALKANGWHAVTLDQLEAYWTKGAALGPGKPIVISFDGGYASQYANAVPVLKRLGWVGVENLELNGLAPSDGGISESQVRGLISAGWELDTQGIGGTDLITLDPATMQQEVASARQLLRSRYGVAGNWFSYPQGHYDPSVIAAVRSAGFVGSTTVIPGWASPQDDRFRLPRLQVKAGTSPSQLLSEIDAAKSSTSIPSSYSGSAVT